jgi:hypothetical protein
LSVSYFILFRSKLNEIIRKERSSERAWRQPFIKKLKGLPENFDCNKEASANGTAHRVAIPADGNNLLSERESDIIAVYRGGQLTIEGKDSACYNPFVADEAAEGVVGS